ncbi:MAG: DMT family transporter [Acidimicrobiales bacterium]|nr:DMT family transporter [Acidimicrobiales bacterium]
MKITVSVACAIAAAALFAVASAIQAKALRELRKTDDPEVHRRSELARALSSGMWLTGAVVSGGAFALHVVALHEGNLTLVQPLLVTAVLFALPASRAAGGPRITTGEVFWAVVLVLSLAGFFVAADPLNRSGTQFDRGPFALAAGLAVAAIALCVGLARRRAGGEAAALLGAGAGIAFAGVAALVKASSGQLTHGVAQLVTSWEPYTALAVGLAGVVLSQFAFRAGPLSASVPAMNSINPLVSVLLGVIVFDDKVRSGVAASTAQSAALLVVTVATVWLSRAHRLEAQRSSRLGSEVWEA